MFRVYTEDVSVTLTDTAQQLAANYFDAFTLVKGIGCWRNQFERSLVFDIEHSTRDKVLDFAWMLKQALGQQAVLVVELASTGVLV